MDIKKVNLENRSFMRSITQRNYEFKWNDDNLMSILLGEMPMVRYTNYDNDDAVKDEITQLRLCLKGYRFEKVEQESFREKVKNTIESIQQKEPRWYGVSQYEVITFLDMQKFCLISGYGGVGKSYFVYCLEEELEKRNIEHLCVYGKHQKNLDGININEIESISKDKLFVLVLDAINEFDSECQKLLITGLKRLSKCRNVRIIATYRVYQLTNDIEAKLKEMSTYNYEFQGVSYESALDIIMQIPALNTYRYESILYTNNALLLTVLCKVLQKQKVAREMVGSVSTITYILETYIKETTSKDNWKKTKSVLKWMYDHGKRFVPMTVLTTLVENGGEYVAEMLQQGMLIEYKGKTDIELYFAIETLTDFLLARYFIQEARGKNVEDQIRIITKTRRSFTGMDEAIILALFDLTDDYSRIGCLLEATDLLDKLDLNVLSHINFSAQQAVSFQESFRIKDTTNLLISLGGYSCKPYNCKNYLNNYYLHNPTHQMAELSKTLSGTHFIRRIAERLKNMVYFVSVVNEDVPEEVFWFALWCTASANQRTRCYAVKLLYEVISKNSEYIDLIIGCWSYIVDPYIQEAIVEVLSLEMNETDCRIKSFLDARIEEQSFHLARSLKFIAASQGTPYSYIKWVKEDLYQYEPSRTVTDRMRELLFHIDIYDKYFLPFRFESPKDLDNVTEFMTAQRREVHKWNHLLSNRFSCVKTGICQGSFQFEEEVLRKYHPNFPLEVLDGTSFLLSFERCIEHTMEHYGIDIFRGFSGGIEQFGDSVYRKVLDISKDTYYGSLMCNYYVKQFASYNNTQGSIGYEVYDPLPYDDERMYYASPVPTYNSIIEGIGDKTISHIEQYEIYTDRWSKDADLSIENLRKLLVDPVAYKHEQWVLLNARIHLSDQGRIETYDIHCCTNSDVHLTGQYRDRFLSIELEHYDGNVNLYEHCANEPWLCKYVYPIAGRNEWFDNTELVFPPAQIISDLKLHYEISSMSWNSDDGQVVIRCDNTKEDYYTSRIAGAVYMKKDIFDYYTKRTPIHYFCFTEKMLEGRGYTDEASLHLEFCNGVVIGRFSNYEEQRNPVYQSVNPLCENCPYAIVENRPQELESLHNILSLYGVE